MYGKHFQSTYNGSMVGSGPVVFAVWGYVISHTRESIVELNPVILGAILGCHSDEVEKAISKLCAPDEKSRSPENDGRRLIKKTEFAYFVPTYEKYQNIRNEVERREYMKNYMRDYRKNQQGTDVNVNSKLGKPPLAHSYTDSNSDSDISVVTSNKTETLSGKQPDVSPSKRKINNHNVTARDLLTFLNEKTGRNYQPVKVNLDMITARLKEGATERQCRLVILRKFHDWGTDEKMQEYLRPATLFNRTKFAQYVGEIPKEETNG